MHVLITVTIALQYVHVFRQLRRGFRTIVLHFFCTRMKYGEHVDDIHVLLHTYNDTHTQHSVKKYIYFILSIFTSFGGGYLSVEGLLFNWRRCVFHLEGIIFLCVSTEAG